MAKVAGNEIRPGMMISHEGGLWMAVKCQAVKPGKGGAYNQVELKNIVSGTKQNTRFRADEGVEEIYLEKKDFQYLYANGDMLTFMDMESFDQIEIEKDFVGDHAQFLQDGMKVLVQVHEGRPIGIKLPQHVTLEVVEADAVMRGGTAAPWRGPACVLTTETHLWHPCAAVRRRVERLYHPRLFSGVRGRWHGR